MRIPLLLPVALLAIACGGSPAPTDPVPPTTETTETNETTEAIETRPVCDAVEVADGATDVLQNERIGGIGIGSSADDVSRAFGPATTTGPRPNEVEGGSDWTWRYPERGLSLTMHADDEHQSPLVYAITLEAGATLETRFGIRVGSPVADVDRAYGACLSDESTDESKIAGSVYGGVIFTIADGAVKSIFVGAAAE